MWRRRIERAEELAQTVPEAAEILRFYILVAAFQQSIEEASLPDLPLDSPELDGILAPEVERLRKAIGRPAPTELLKHLVLQGYAEWQARRSGINPQSVQPLCPFCGEKPAVAVLRPEGDGGKRFLLCSLCATEWEFRRLVCAHCGEEDKEKLPIYTAEQFPYIRIEACDTCRTYLKAIDLTKNGLAVPAVDELASISLDLWAQEQGYER